MDNLFEMSFSGSRYMSFSGSSTKTRHCHHSTSNINSPQSHSPLQHANHGLILLLLVNIDLRRITQPRMIPRLKRRMNLTLYGLPDHLLNRLKALLHISLTTHNKNILFRMIHSCDISTKKELRQDDQHPSTYRGVSIHQQSPLDPYYE